VRVALGVPEMIQVVALIFSPEGRAGVVLQANISEPLLFKIVGVTLISKPNEPVVPVEPA
jgi:hypothetical protein